MKIIAEIEEYRLKTKFSDESSDRFVPASVFIPVHVDQKSFFFHMYELLYLDYCKTYFIAFSAMI